MLLQAGACRSWSFFVLDRSLHVFGHGQVMLQGGQRFLRPGPQIEKEGGLKRTRLGPRETVTRPGTVKEREETT
jgi:hypothetical protein